MEWTTRDSTWLRTQILHSPVHWIGSMGLYLGAMGFACWGMQANIMDSTRWAFWALLMYATIGEYNQHVIKCEQGVRLVDIVDAVMDWCSWVFFPMIVTGAFV